MHKKLALAFLAPAFFSSAALFPAQVFAKTSYESAAPIAYMIDMSSGAVLLDKQSDRQIPPASMAKMMTAYVVFDMVSKGKLQLNQKLTVTPEIWKKWNNMGSTMFLSAGEKVTVENLLHGTVTLSGNDSAITLAEGISGSEASFVTEMNKTARKLGMKNTRFGTANGWPDEGRTLTTAQDLSVLAQRTISDFPVLYKKFYGKENFTWNGVTQPDRNPLLGKVAGADGLKTGHTDEAGYCFTGTAVQNGRRLLMVIAGVDSFNGRIEESTNLMNWGFSAWDSKPVFSKGNPIASIPVQLGTQRNLALVAPRQLSVTLPSNSTLKYKLFVRYKGPVKAPIAKGDVVADLVIKLSDGSEQVTPLASTVAISQAGYLGRAWNGLLGLFDI
jgi:serine-type D-Ala-D-Ala carboxypeptidase (penicillin-binding protein 5/6)